MIKPSVFRIPVEKGCLAAIIALCSVVSAQQNVETLNPGAASQDAQALAAQIPKYKSQADFVTVPVVVLRKGKNAAGLSKEAFRLEENGKEQTISLFEEVQAPAGVSPVSADRGFSNLPFDNARQLRLTIIVLDLLNTSVLQRTDGRDQIARFLSKGLIPNQPVSLICLTSKGLKLVHPFSTDASALIGALNKISLEPVTIMDRRTVVVRTIDQMKEIAQAYRGIPGRKTMILAIGNIPEIAPEHEIIETMGYTLDLRDMWQSLIDANIAVYPIQLMSWSRDPSLRGLASRSNDMLLRNVAEFTGGNLCMEVNDLFRCMAHAVEDSQAYYLLGFSVQPNDRKPGWRDLKVKVSEPHVDIRARDGFYFGISPIKDAESTRKEEVSALASALARSAVPMYVKVLGPASPATPSSSGEKKTIEFLVTIPFSSVKIDITQPHPLDLEVGAIALTRDMREAAEFLHPVSGNPGQYNLQLWERDGIKLQEKLDLARGSFDIRFLVRDNNAEQIGTVVFPLDVH